MGKTSDAKNKKMPAYLDVSLGFDLRVADLINRMTPEEKLSQLSHAAAAIDRLKIPAYDWWSEALHGVARAGIATVFPQAIGLAAMFDEHLLFVTAIAVSDEARAKYHMAVKKGKRQRYYGLTMWSPNINIFRDPRWGRGQETYGEDPYLTAKLGVAYIKGLQGSDKKYLKTAACAKHFAVHSGPDPMRLSFDAKVSKKDLYETYLPAFKAAVLEAGVESVMGAYNRVNGEPACASNELIGKILREEWGFKGHVVSDCSAIENIYLSHKTAPTPEVAAAMALNAGCDLNCCLEKCDEARINMKKAFAAGLITEHTVDMSLERLFMTRMKLGMFDRDDMVDYAGIPAKVVDCDMHRRFALGVAKASMVLLKNNGVLPLYRPGTKSVAVIGPNADEVKALLGNYNGDPAEPVTPLKGMQKTGVIVNYAKGCGLKDGDKKGFKDAIAAASKSDAAVFCAGLSPDIEGEECDTGGYERENLGLPGVQAELLDELKKLNKPLILVLLSGSALSVEPAKADAILQAWYPGQSGGDAIAEIIFGKYSPAGRLPVTVYRSEKDLPDFTDYSMKNRTYRYFKGDVLYPFGWGLSYAKFTYKDLVIGSAGPDMPVVVNVTVENAGKLEADEVVQVYIRDVKASCRVPKHSLAGFKRITLKPWQKETVSFTLSYEQFCLVNEDGKTVFEPGEFEIFAGGVQPGFECPTTMVLSGKITL